MKTEKLLLITTLTAIAALAKYRLVSYAGAPTTAGTRALGIAVTNFDAGELAGIATHGELLLEAGAAIAVGAEVESDGVGRAVTKTTGIAFGVARDAASAAGDIIRVLV